MIGFPPGRRLLHVALAEGRGHLVRAHRLRLVLAPHGVEVEIATTTLAGQRFLAALGTPSWVLPGGFELAFDERQRLDKPTLHKRLARYLANGFAHDIDALGRRNVAGYINDSFHPALLLSRKLVRRTVLVHGDSLEEAVLEHWDGTPLERPYRRFATGLLSKPRGILHHSAVVSSRACHNERTVLPPLLLPLVESDAEVRSRIGAPLKAPIAVVYLNPYFRDRMVGRVIQQALGQSFHVHAVAEGFAHLRGWVAADPQLPEVIARASVFVSSPGMAAIAEAQRSSVPFIAIEGDQPEQSRNLARMERTWPKTSFARVSVEGSEADFERAFLDALSRVRCRAAGDRAFHALGAPANWAFAIHEAFQIGSEGEQQSGNQTECSVGIGDEQPAWGNRDRTRGRARAAFVTARAANLFAWRPSRLGDHA